MRKPTIAIIGSKGYPFVYSGYETFIKELAPRLANKYEVHIYCHRSLFQCRRKIIDGIHLHYLPAIETKWFTHPTHGLLCTIHAIAMRYDLYFYVNSCNGPFGHILKAFKKDCVINTDGLEWLRPQKVADCIQYQAICDGL